MAFETVYSWDYYDGVQSGFADFRGDPVYFCRVLDEAGDEFKEPYEMCGIDEETLGLASERETIWRRWELAYSRGEVLLNTHPATPGVDAGFAALEAMIQAKIELTFGRSVAHGNFREVSKVEGCFPVLEVEWTEIGRQ